MSRYLQIWKLITYTDYDKNNESSYLKYWHVNSLYEWTMLQKLPVDNFEQIKETS